MNIELVKSSHCYLGRLASSAIGWCQKGPCVKLRLHDKKIQNLKITAKICTRSLKIE